MITSHEFGRSRQDDSTLARLSTREAEREGGGRTETARQRETERTVRARALTGVIRLCHPLGHPNKVHKHIIKLNERWDSDEF